jgi:hypothetical protein
MIEHLLYTSLVDSEDEALEKIIKSIHSIQSLSKIDFTPNDNGEYQLYILGNQCDALMMNYKTIFQNLISKEKIDLWGKCIGILNRLKNGTNNLNKLTEDIKNWFNKFKIEKGKSSWYIHIILNHTNQLLGCYKKLCVWSNEGLEHLHKHIKRILEDRVQHGTNKAEYHYKALFHNKSKNIGERIIINNEQEKQKNQEMIEKETYFKKK